MGVSLSCSSPRVSVIVQLQAMDEPFEIIDLSGKIDRNRREETMGTKKKWWLTHKTTDVDALLKFSRPDSGEDWSERVAHEIARLLGIPGPPRLELATYEGEHATLSWSFLEEGESLIHGNELLSQLDTSYPVEGFYHVAQHSLSAVEKVLSKADIPPRAPSGFAWADGFEVFIGYLMLDALIGNTDRHHQNWAVISSRKLGGAKRQVWLAPSYDHASSLGRELSDVNRARRLTAPAGRGDLAAYVQKATSALYDDTGGQLAPLAAFRQCSARRPAAYQWWLDTLHEVTVGSFLATVDRVPDVRLSAKGKEFSKELLRFNFDRIVSSRP
jgi:HipA-like C-terminal domain